MARKYTEVVYVDVDTKRRLKALAALGSESMGEYLETIIAMRWENWTGESATDDSECCKEFNLKTPGENCGSEVDSVGGYNSKRINPISGKEPNPSAGYNSGMGKAKERKDIPSP